MQLINFLLIAILNSFQIDEVRKRLLEEGVDLELFAAIPSTSVYHSSINSYSLTKRIGIMQLINIFAKSVKEAQLNYAKSIEKAQLFLYANLHGCQEMDRIIGDREDEDLGNCEQFSKTDVMKQKDGTKKLPCPFHKCSVETFRLRRHLRRSHSHLSSADIDKLTKLMIFMASNTDGNTELTNAQQITPKMVKMKGDEKTNLVSRKHNWKMCVLCDTLQLNMTTHLKATHKISKETDPAIYRTYLNDSKVVPKCYLKKVNGRMTMLADDELKRAKENNEETIQKQEKVNEKLKELREKREEAYKKKSEAVTEDARALAEETWKEADSRYKELRYQGVRTYSDKLSEWRDAFVAHLTKREYCNPKRMCNMAMDLMLNFEKESGRSIAPDDILQPKKIRLILESYKSTSNITATSKLKYLGAFNLFIKFIFLDVDSPEYESSVNTTDMMVRDFTFKQVKQEISNLQVILSLIHI